MKRETIVFCAPLPLDDSLFNLFAISDENEKLALCWRTMLALTVDFYFLFQEAVIKPSQNERSYRWLLPTHTHTHFCIVALWYLFAYNTLVGLAQKKSLAFLVSQIAAKRLPHFLHVGLNTCDME